MRGVGIAGVLGIALIHLIDLPRAMGEASYLGVLYLGLVAGCIMAGWLLLQKDPRLGWGLAGVLAGATLIGFVVSRTVGLPGMTDDIGHWTEPLGVSSLVVEAAVVCVSTQVLARGRMRAERGRPEIRQWHSLTGSL